MGAKINPFLYLKNFIKTVLKELCDLVYKRKCINCGCQIPVKILCKNCAKSVQYLPFYAQSTINGFNVYSAFYYEGAVKKLIQALKFKHNKVISLYLAEYLFDYINSVINNKQNGLSLEDAIIIPVLTHKKNYNKRGYDNVLLIAEELSNLSGYELKKSITKTKYTEPMYNLTRKERLRHIEGSFGLNADFDINKPVILLDDIITTGSTLNYLTGLFKEKGIKNLICLTVAKTRFNNSNKKRF